MIEEEEEIVKPNLKPLGAIFKRNFRHLKVQNLELPSSTTTTPSLPQSSPKIEQDEVNDIEDLAVFNSKLCWLSNTPQPVSDASFALPADLDFPDLSAENNQLITKMCPKVNNGHLCSLKDCKYQHPPKREVKKIVSDMRHLKKRIINDVLNVIETDEKKKSPPPNPPRNKPCKFQDKCKFKNTTCPYIHDNTEPGQCQFGVKCKLVITDDDKNVVGNNTKMKKKCTFIHPNESKEVYLTRQK